MKTTRTLTAVVATSNPVLSFQPSSGRTVLDALVLEGGEIPEAVPLLIDHQLSIPTMIGSVREFRLEEGEMLARLLFAEGHTGAEEAWQLASQRHLRSVSIRYRTLEAQDVQPGRTAFIAGRSWTAPTNRVLTVVTRWKALEVSVTPIGADPGAMIRSAKEGNLMTVPLRVGHSVSPRRLVDLLSASLTRGERPQNDHDVIRAGLSSADGFQSVNGLVNSAILDGFRQSQDTTAGWIRTVPLPNYLLSNVAFSETAVRLSRVGRGDTAATVAFGLSSATGWRLGRFGCAFAFDEQDMLDHADIGLLQVAMAEVGAAARRIIPDMVYALLLTNATLADGVALFHTSRGNIASGGPSALSATSLDTAMGAIAGQRLTDQVGDPVHVNLEPRYVVVAPDDIGAARRYARDVATGDGDLIVRAESRLTTAGVVDPRDDEIVQGNGNNWLMAASAEQAPGVVVGLLNGKTEPTIRITPLDRGEWGIAVDVQFNVGVCAVDGRPLYWSQGQ